jgi:lipopolysaccharide export system permease protein
MLFHKSLLRELRSTAGGVLAILMTTLVTMILIRALGRVASGRVDGELVLPLIVFNTVSLMNTVLMLTVYISVLMVLSRWWRDSEMVIWLASGKSLLDFVKPVWRFLWPMMLVVAVLSTVGSRS